MIRRIPLFCFTALTVATCIAASPFGQAANGAPVAIVGSQPILEDEDELSPLIEGELQRLRIQEYQAKRNALDDLINQKLIAAKAKEKGLTSFNAAGFLP